MSSTNTRHDELKRTQVHPSQLPLSTNRDNNKTKYRYPGDGNEEEDYGIHDPDCTMGKHFTY